MHIFLNISFFFSFSSLHGHMKGGEAYLKKKKESPWGFPERERKENGKERGWECGEEGECIRPRQAEPKTRKRRNEY